MATLKEILAQLEKENKNLPDTYSTMIQTFDAEEVIAKYGDCQAERNGEYGVEICGTELGGWASRKR